MKTVVVKKYELLDAVKKNLEAHKAEYDEAIANMCKEAEMFFKQQSKNIKQGKAFNKSYTFIEPENHEEDYKQVIRMLEMTVDDEIELSYHDFSRYVMDNWDWTERFKSTTLMYNG